MLQFWLPIALGFLIGTVTNYIAILMLFRPHQRTPWLFFWQQGLIPRERKALGESVGKAVGEELLSPAEIEAIVSGPGGRERTAALLDRIVEATAQHLARRPVAELVQAASWEAWAQNLRSYLDETERRKALSDWLEGILRERLALVDQQTVEEVLGKATLDEIEKLLCERLRRSRWLKTADGLVKKSRYFFTPSFLFEWLYGNKQASGMDKLAGDLARYLVDGLRQKRFGEILGLRAEEDQGEAATKAAERILDHLTAQENLKSFIDGVRQNLDPLLTATPEELTGKIDPAVLEGAREGMEDLVHDLLCTNAAAAVGALDIASVVQERVDEYPTSELERLVLEISGRHLKWITLWGGLLGALMGALQILVQRLL